METTEATGGERHEALRRESLISENGNVHDRDSAHPVSRDAFGSGTQREGTVRTVDGPMAISKGLRESHASIASSRTPETVMSLFEPSKAADTTLRQRVPFEPGHAQERDHVVETVRQERDGLVEAVIGLDLGAPRRLPEPLPGPEIVLAGPQDHHTLSRKPRSLATGESLAMRSWSSARSWSVMCSSLLITRPRWFHSRVASAVNRLRSSGSVAASTSFLISFWMPDHCLPQGTPDVLHRVDVVVPDRRPWEDLPDGLLVRIATIDVEAFRPQSPGVRAAQRRRHTLGVRSETSSVATSRPCSSLHHGHASATRSSRIDLVQVRLPDCLLLVQASRHPLRVRRRRRGFLEPATKRGLAHIYVKQFVEKPRQRP